jgi:hypothetical protein
VIACGINRARVVLARECGSGETSRSWISSRHLGGAADAYREIVAGLGTSEERSRQLEPQALCQLRKLAVGSALAA